MSNLIAEINGVPVYSDKEVSMISGTTILFADGSSCDVSTLQVVNKGPGHISIGAPAEGEKKKKRTTSSLSGSALEVFDLSASLKVSPHDGGEISVTVLAFEDEHENIVVREQNGTVSVTAKSKRSKGGNSTFLSDKGVSLRNVSIGSIQGGGISIVGGRITSGGNTIVMGGAEPEVIIEILVPRGTPVSVSHVNGPVEIGNTEGNLTVKASDVDNIDVGSVRNLIVHQTGVGDTRVESVEGSANLRTDGVGNITINGGKISNLTAHITGVGDIKVRCEVRDADLKTTGVGDIKVNSVTGNLKRSSPGIGEIKVKNR